MMEKTINQLKNVIVQQQFINCFSGEFHLDDQGALEQFLTALKSEYEQHTYVDIDVQNFEDCEGEEQEANVLLQLINKELTSAVDIQPVSIANVLIKASNNLDGRALLVFHCFRNFYSETEKNILRSLRRTIRNRDNMSSKLGILIISNRTVSRWELYPESNLDDRHVAPFEFEYANN